MRHKCDASETCPVMKGVEVVGDWWSFLIVRDAFLGRKRFGEFQTSLGVAKNILTDRLRKLVEAGVFEQVPASDGSTYKEYALTDRGRDLLPVLVALGDWGAADGAVMPVVERKTGKPVRLEFRTADGQRLKPEDVQLEPEAAERAC